MSHHLCYCRRRPLQSTTPSLFYGLTAGASGPAENAKDVLAGLNVVIGFFFLKKNRISNKQEKHTWLYTCPSLLLFFFLVRLKHSLPILASQVSQPLLPYLIREVILCVLRVDLQQLCLDLLRRPPLVHGCATHRPTAAGAVVVRSLSQHSGKREGIGRISQRQEQANKRVKIETRRRHSMPTALLLVLGAALLLSCLLLPPLASS